MYRVTHDNLLWTFKSQVALVSFSSFNKQYNHPVHMSILGPVHMCTRPA